MQFQAKNPLPHNRAALACPKNNNSYSTYNDLIATLPSVCDCPHVRPISRHVGFEFAAIHRHILKPF
jgi:hypothetical protein